MTSENRWFCPYCENEVSGPDAECCGELHAVSEVEQLRTVALAAKALVLWIGDDWQARHVVDDKPLTALESALAAAGYDMTDQELYAREAV